MPHRHAGRSFLPDYGPHWGPVTPDYYPKAVVRQPRRFSDGGFGKPLRGWSSGLCDCGEDVASCVCVGCCLPCYTCHLAVKAGEWCCLPLWVPGWLIALRSHIRGKYGIHGTVTNDCCSVTCCYPCAMCQVSREISHVNNLATRR